MFHAEPRRKLVERVYYADGSTYEGDMAFAPTRNVICIGVEPRKAKPGEFHRWRVLSEFDYYILLSPPGGSWRMSGWHGVNHLYDVFEHLCLSNLSKGEVVTVLKGVQVSKETYDDIVLAAERDYGVTTR